MVPNVDVIKSWAIENNIPGTLTVLCNDSNVKELIVTDMLAWGKDGGLKSFEQVRWILSLLFDKIIDRRRVPLTVLWCC